MADPMPRPVFRPSPARPNAAPTIVRPRRDSGLFKGWGVTL
ncbi:MAG TPA: hypothetical protein VHS78_06235 [Candidatus Elarobacter sp.]|jgi:hypothetical protein|nr:hypothetical protein [Candidatus Elarobacter sp.]